MLNTLQKVSLASKTKKPFLLHTLNTNRNRKNISSEAENISILPEDGPTFSHYVNEFLLQDGIRKSNEVYTVTISFVLVNARKRFFSLNELEICITIN